MMFLFNALPVDFLVDSPGLLIPEDQSETEFTTEFFILNSAMFWKLLLWFNLTIVWNNQNLVLVLGNHWQWFIWLYCSLCKEWHTIESINSFGFVILSHNFDVMQLTRQQEKSLKLWSEQLVAIFVSHFVISFFVVHCHKSKKWLYCQ